MDKNNPNWCKVNKSAVEDMLYLIVAHAGRTEARRFNGLSYQRRQKVTYILKNRARRARNHTQPIDLYIVREVIDDAKKNVFMFE